MKEMEIERLTDGTDNLLFGDLYMGDFYESIVNKGSVFKKTDRGTAVRMIDGVQFSPGADMPVTRLYFKLVEIEKEKP